MHKLKITVFALLTFQAAQLMGADQAPIGIAPVTLTASPYVFDTAEQHGIKVSVLAKGLERSFSMAFLPDGDLLVSERGGLLRLIRGATGANPVLDAQPVLGVPQLDPPYRNGGLHDLALHPDFAQNHWLYFSYNKGEPNVERPRSAVALMRGRYENGRLQDVEELFVSGYGSTSGLAFYTGDKFPAWKGNLFIGSSRRGEVDRTGGLERVVFNENMGDIRRETLLTDLHQRIRDVRQGPDGLLYVLTDGDEFAVLRISPN